MDSQLQSLSELFNNRLFRIPDYQRGYAWGTKQLQDFWSDLEQLQKKANHYTGVLTLEAVSESVYKKWDEDAWIIEDRGYKPYYVVDGQQRLTTILILLQVLCEQLEDNQTINSTNKADIRRSFLSQAQSGGLATSYIFGYERDNPSYEYLKTSILGDFSSSNDSRETRYTQNLRNAKLFFQTLLEKCTSSELASLHTKITRQLLFNIFTITQDVEVCVAFETMNNRGKPLSYLELLKNRLIYLTIKFPITEHDRSALRRSINDTWKNIYEVLGRQSTTKLEDDTFLMSHYISYRGQAILKDLEKIMRRRLHRFDGPQEVMGEYLLQHEFVPSRIYAAKGKLKLQEVNKYVISLQKASRVFCDINAPLKAESWHADTAILVDRLLRLNPVFSQTVLLSLFTTYNHNDPEFNRTLEAMERSMFSLRWIGRLRSFEVDDSIIMAATIASKKRSLLDLWKMCDHAAINRVEIKELIEVFKSRNNIDGFYGLWATRYLLYEYEMSLHSLTKTKRQKLFWPEFAESESDYITLEHIFPQTPAVGEWEEFSSYTKSQQKRLANSLGNLLPLSKAKNASLSNRPFSEKRSTPGIAESGYVYGCYSEVEVARETTWTPQLVLKRGLKLLDFAEKRWGFNLGTREQKIDLLGLGFVKE